jgi:hypothetical protein
MGEAAVRKCKPNRKDSIEEPFWHANRHEEAVAG